MPRHLMVGSVLGGCLAVAFLGCSFKDRVVRGTATGRVTLAGKPLTNATVLFENKSEGVALLASLSPDGSYEVKTYQAEGLPVGTYQIAITPGALSGGDPGPPDLPPQKQKPAPAPTAGPTIPQKYHSTATSGLTAEVKEGKNPPFNFDLKD